MTAPGFRVDGPLEGSGSLVIFVPAKMAAVPFPWCTSQSTVMAVEIFVIALHTAYGDGHVMNHAESFAVIRKCMVKATPMLTAIPSLRAHRAARIDPRAASQKAATSSFE